MGPAWGCGEEQKSHQDVGQFLVVLWIPPMSPGAGEIARPENFLSHKASLAVLVQNTWIVILSSNN